MMSKKHLQISALALVLACLSGCGDAVVVNRSEGVSTYNADTYVQSLAQNGTNGVVVVNDPYGPAGDQAIVTALQSRYASSQYRFALGTTAPDWNGYTIVLGFGEPIGSQTQCTTVAPSRTTGLFSGQTLIIADYCYGTRVVSEATGYARHLSGPDDPVLGKLAAAVFAEMVINRPPGGSGSGQVTTTQ
jgi:hypothetical protein